MPYVYTQQGGKFYVRTSRKPTSTRGPDVTQGPPQISATSGTGGPTEGPKVISELPQIDPTTAWKIFVDGVKNSLGAGAGIVLKSPDRAIFEQCLKLNFPATNNKVENEAFIVGLRSASKLRVPELHIFSDSKLVVNKVTKQFKARGHKMAKYLTVAKSLLTDFKAVKIEQVGKDLNSHANALAGLTSVFEGEVGRTITVEIISAPSLER